ncbi:hypothetical protein NDU88_000904 [Pleurodeles waltl]|uniref:Uncharacterized protein n=1 Tax=Pleurodeles waltl TaxID=8319 RepID=A0AAV7UUN9_PLEWA|nr:hypothetical protein NDU88_000904 [Pleurodeles waltl]
MRLRHGFRTASPPQLRRERAEDRHAVEFADLRCVHINGTAAALTGDSEKIHKCFVYTRVRSLGVSRLNVLA